MSDLNELSYAGITADKKLWQACPQLEVSRTADGYTVSVSGWNHTSEPLADLVRARIESGASDERALVRYMQIVERRSLANRSAHVIESLAQALKSPGLHLDHTLEIGLAQALRAMLSQAVD